jgi:hypothetical protein
MSLTLSLLDNHINFSTFTFNNNIFSSNYCLIKYVSVHGNGSHLNLNFIKPPHEIAYVIKLTDQTPVFTSFYRTGVCSSINEITKNTLINQFPLKNQKLGFNKFWLNEFSGVFNSKIISYDFFVWSAIDYFQNVNLNIALLKKPLSIYWEICEYNNTLAIKNLTEILNEDCCKFNLGRDISTFSQYSDSDTYRFRYNYVDNTLCLNSDERTFYKKVLYPGYS